MRAIDRVAIHEAMEQVCFLQLNKKYEHLFIIIAFSHTMLANNISRKGWYNDCFK